MKRTLGYKLIGGIVLYGVLGFLLVASLVEWTFQQKAQSTEATKLYKEALAITSNYAEDYYRNRLTQEELEEQMRVLSSYTEGEIWIVDRKGIVLIGKEKSGEPYEIPDFRISDFGTKYYCIGHFYDCFDEQMLTVFAPITVDYQVRGYVMIHKSIRHIYQDADYFLNMSYMALLSLLIFSMTFLVMYLWHTYHRIWRMNRIAHQYMEGNFTAVMEDGSEDELGFLSASFNYMANELNTLEEDQRKFVSNISHDFRSPLTSIKGYVEAMLDGTIPVEMQEKYLNIIITETERLTKLTSGLIELNKYGGHGKTILDKTDFDINAVIGQTAATFEGVCNEKHIVLELVLTGDELFVHADKSKIQQIIYNLTDNAIKFSHQDSVIRLETHVKNEKVFVSVKDSGIGIPKESIGKIWERFYKTDLSRGKDKKGTGIGLAIVKEIVQAHGENINVISTEGVGTEFIFTLPFVDDTE
ncbi:MAG: HAMP domain-containing sensor histidine kinase [bacterium]|nr:HAMP domain-containing sensor histidine kinase [bacterium]MDY4098360.1 HAMP domain-containing sensor histidine kinase [Lachnospiraceae bacterium]